MATFRIDGIGTAQPDGTFTQRDAEAEAALLCCHTPEHRRTLGTIYRQSAVHRRATVLTPTARDDDAARHEGPSPPTSVATSTATPLRTFFPLPRDANDRGPSVAARMAAYAQHAPLLAREAASRALAEAQLAPHRIAHLITVSCTGFSAPGLDVQLIDALGLNRDVQRTMIGFMGCHGAINALRTAASLGQSLAGKAAGEATGEARGEHVLVCCVELCSLHFQYGWEAQRVVANALFADGAAAVVGACDEPAAAPSPARVEIGSAATSPTNGTSHNGRGPSAKPWRLWATGSYLVPATREAMTWTIGAHGFEMTLSQRVPRLIRQHLRPWLTKWLAGQGLTLAEVRSWAVHPGGPRVLDAVEAGLELAPDALEVSREVLAACGNMSSPTILFILDRLRRRHAPRPCVSLAFGPGLTIEAALWM